MNLKRYLEIILPAEGNYYTAQMDNTGKLRQHKHEDIAQAITSLELITSKHLNAYIATGSFSNARSQAAIKKKRAFYVDIDCKEGGQYPDKPTALAAIKLALKNGLPPFTIIVDSGNGYHLYWALDEDLPVKKWKPLNNGLIKACEQVNLLIDPSVTQDSARLLRAPESVNYKDPKNPKACKILRGVESPYTYDDFVSKFEQWIARPNNVTPIGIQVDVSDLTGGIEHEGKKPKAQQMVSLCPIFKKSMAEGGKHDGENLWHQILYTLSFTEDGKDYIHPISQDHDDYSQRETENRFARYMRDREDENNTFGPTTCARFSALSPECSSCEFNGKDLFKSPIKLGFGAPSELPFPWRNGQFGVERKDEDDGWELAIRYKVTDFEITFDHVSRTTLAAFKIGGRDIEGELSEILDGVKGRAILNSSARPLEDYEFREFKSLMTAWTQLLSSTGREKKSNGKQFGWVDKGFHYGGMIYRQDGSTEPAWGTDKKLVEVYSPTGDFQVWQQCANHILSTNRPAAWAMIASAFAAPLIKFTGLSGTILSIVSQESGTGKSTAMKVAQAVWGHPKRGIASLNDTANAVSHKMGALQHLPAYWDEVREKEEVQRFIQNLFRIAQGVEKQRLTQSIQMREVGSWDTMIGIASNEPLRDHIVQRIGNSDAGAARLFEIKTNAISDNLSDAQARQMFGKLAENFGHAGEQYARWLSANKDQAVAMVEAIDHKIVEALQTKNPERFWVATVASLIAGASLANKLGLCKFDLKALQSFLIKEFKKMRSLKDDEWESKDTQAANLLSQYMTDHRGHIIKCDNLSKAGGTKSNILIDADRSPVAARLALKGKEALIPVSVFSDWYYRKYGSGYTQVVDNLVAMGASKSKYTVDVGSAASSHTRCWCLRLDVSDSKYGIEVEDYADNTDLG